MEELVYNGVGEYLILAVILTCFVCGFIIRNYTEIPNKYIPLLMIFVGIVGNVALTISQNNPIGYFTILSGAISGLASSGGYDLISKSFGFSMNREGKNANPENIYEEDCR